MIIIIYFFFKPNQKKVRSFPQIPQKKNDKNTNALGLRTIME
jgi:hypothetical protein